MRKDKAHQVLEAGVISMQVSFFRLHITTCSSQDAASCLGTFTATLILGGSRGIENLAFREITVSWQYTQVDCRKEFSPGFIIQSGSKLLLSFCITPIVSTPSSFTNDPFLPMPMPCSPVQVPSISNALSTMRYTQASTFFLCSGSVASYKIDSWKFPSPICPSTLANSPKSSISFLLISTISASRDIGTATSVDQTSSLPLRSASMLHRLSLRADHRAFCSFSSTVNSNSPPWFWFEIWRTCSTCSATAPGVPLNLKNSVGVSVHFFFVAPARLTTFICTSSMISIAATGMPLRITLALVAAQSRIDGKEHTATEVCWGITASLSVISVTTPRVPSLPTKSPVRLYPAADLRGRRRVLITLPSASTTVRLITQSRIVP
jgi:hypothetical protein